MFRHAHAISRRCIYKPQSNAILTYNKTLRVAYGFLFKSNVKIKNMTKVHIGNFNIVLRCVIERGVIKFYNC
jgi:hypothetical protein